MCVTISPDEVTKKANEFPLVTDAAQLNDLVLQVLGLEFVGCTACEAGLELTAMIDSIAVKRSYELKRLRMIYSSARNHTADPATIQAFIKPHRDRFPSLGIAIHRAVYEWMEVEKLVGEKSTLAA